MAAVLQMEKVSFIKLKLTKSIVSLKISSLLSRHQGLFQCACSSLGVMFGVFSCRREAQEDVILHLGRNQMSPQRENLNPSPHLHSPCLLSCLSPSCLQDAGWRDICLSVSQSQLQLGLAAEVTLASRCPSLTGSPGVV